MRRFEVRLGSRAAAELARLPGQHRGRLIQRLQLWARECPDEGLLVVDSRGDLAACEVLPDRELILVYAIQPVSRMHRLLLGAAIDRRITALGIRRTLHGNYAPR